MSQTYLASLDSVRFENPDHPTRFEFASSQNHAEIEILIALLFGQQIVVSENQSFDSAGFLDIAMRILDDRPKKAHSRRFGNPFKLALRRGKDLPKDDFIPHLNYRKMIAALMLRQEKFILSANPEISKDKIARKKFAKAIMKDPPNFNDVKEIIGTEKVTKYTMLSDYFDEKHTSQTIGTDIADVLLPEYTQWLKKLSPKELESLVPQDPQRAIELRDAFDDLEKAGISFSDRSAVRNHGASLLPPDLFTGVLEYVDGSYNRVVASSVCAHDRVFSNRSSNDYARIAGELIDMRPPKHERYWYSDIPLDISIDPSLRIKFAASIPWFKIWDILTDVEWEESASCFQQARVVLSHGQTKNDVQFHAAEDAFYSHVQKLTEMLDERIGSLEVDHSSKIVKFTREIRDASPVPILTVGVKNILLYQFGIPIPTWVTVPIATGIGWAVNPIKSMTRSWNRRGSLRGAIHRSVKLGG